MRLQTLPLLAALLLTTGCALGSRPMPADSLPLPNLAISPEAMEHCPEEIPPPKSGDRSDLLANHIEAMRIYHACRLRQRALSCTIEGQQGVTINGAKARTREACTPSMEPP